MASILVTSPKQDRTLLDEQVRPVQFEDEREWLQMLERLAWAIKEGYPLDDAGLWVR